MRKKITNAAKVAAADASSKAKTLAKDVFRNINGEQDDEDEDMSDLASTNKAAPLILSIKDKIINMFVPGCGIRYFHFGTIFSENVSIDCQGSPKILEGNSRDRISSSYSNDSQQNVYHRCALPAVYDALNGLNTCLLCYGQTGSGKTYTIFGPKGSIESAINASKTGYDLGDSSGIALRAVKDIFDTISLAEDKYSKVFYESANNSKQEKAVRYSVSMQYVQLYNNKVIDLLSGNDVIIRAAGDSFVLHGGKIEHICKHVSHYSSSI